MPSYTARRRTMTDDEIAALYLELHDSELVGLKSGLSGTSVLDICRKLGVPVQPPGGINPRRRNIRLNVDQIVEYYQTGMTAQEVADIAHTNTTMIYTILRENGVKRRTHVQVRDLKRRSKPYGRNEF